MKCNCSTKQQALRDAGLGDADLALLRDGRPPLGWQVHHKLPLDDGGTNAADNLLLIENEPAHKVITVAQKRLTGDLLPGQSRVVDFPVPDGFVYPTQPGLVQSPP